MNALQLADALAADEISVANRSVSDELRRLHAVNAQMLEALKEIARIDPAFDSDKGYNEWGEADCFNQAQRKAARAIAAHKEQTNEK